MGWMQVTSHLINWFVSLSAAHSVWQLEYKVEREAKDVGFETRPPGFQLLQVLVVVASKSTDSGPEFGSWLRHLKAV